MYGGACREINAGGVFRGHMGGSVSLVRGKLGWRCAEVVVGKMVVVVVELVVRSGVTVLRMKMTRWHWCR